MSWGVGRAGSGAVVGITFLLCAAAGAQDGVTRFATGPNAGNPRDIALAHLGATRGTFALKATDIADVRIRDEYVSGRTETTHVYLQQRLNGVEVFGAVAHVNVALTGSVIN